jgi:hypothetical protein
MINTLVTSQNWKEKKRKEILECFFFHFSKAKFDLVVAFMYVWSHLMLHYKIEKNKQKKHTNTHLHHLHFPSDITHDLICESMGFLKASINQSSTYPFLLILKPKKKWMKVSCEWMKSHLHEKRGRRILKLSI